jgi:pimeloyl-ACP methyl ester carboxylesterase
MFAANILDALSIKRAHFVGWSTGAGVVMQLMLDQVLGSVGAIPGWHGQLTPLRSPW